jgi:hypothetical protein
MKTKHFRPQENELRLQLVTSESLGGAKPFLFPCEFSLTGDEKSRSARKGGRVSTQGSADSPYVKCAVIKTDVCGTAAGVGEYQVNKRERS